MARPEQLLDTVIDKLVKDVETAVHALYRGDVRQQTARLRSDVHRKAARDALLPLLAGVPAAAAAPAGAFTPSALPLGPEEVTALSRCVMAWLPMGPPASAEPDSRCVPAGRELMPSWAERERAREALKKRG